MSLTGHRAYQPPIFVVGCPRSGTTLLYHMLLSAGDFVVFRAETHAFSVLAPRFGKLDTRRRRQQLLGAWLTSKAFERSGLDRTEFSERVLNQCRHTGDFLRVFMESIAACQGVTRWAECTPAHLLHMPLIKREIPDALFVHVIRDGRDVAISYANRGWLKALPGDHGSPLITAGMHWAWMVRKGRSDARALGSSYMEIRFEQLVQEPQPLLEEIGRFIDRPLDHEAIKAAAIGSVADPNTSFRAEKDLAFSPIARWRKRLDATQVAALEYILGTQLDELGYRLEADRLPATAAARLLTKRKLYAAYFSAKHWARMNTPLGRLTSIEALSNW